MFLSETERKIAKDIADREFKEKHKSRLDRKITIDFLGHRVLDDDEEKEKLRALEMQMDEEMKAEKEKHRKRMEQEAKNNPLLAVKRIEPKYISQGALKDLKTNRMGIDANMTADTSRIQDSQFQEFIKSDTGKCMAMHQPWAGLLVAGIKVHEGRTWYTKHRGPLWISAAKHEMEDDEFQAIVDNYTPANLRHELPQEWPRSVLLGRVNVVDCLSQEEYRDRFPDGNSSAPYVFICEDPVELDIKIPMDNDHKIFNMDAGVLRAAQLNIAS